MINDQFPASYTTGAKAFHWIMAVIWIAAWIAGFTAAHIWDTPQHVMIFVHKSIASTVLFFTAFRLAWRFTHRPPALPQTMSPRMQFLAHAGHVALYLAALLALPITGWYTSSYAGRPILAAGFIPLPMLTEANPPMAAFARVVHNYTAWTCGLIVLGHILVAFKHHFIDRDDILLRMLPGRAEKA